VRCGDGLIAAAENSEKFEDQVDLEKSDSESGQASDVGTQIASCVKIQDYHLCLRRCLLGRVMSCRQSL
jgi:hypothetical protein